MNWREIGDTTYAAWTALIRSRAPRSPILDEGEAAYEAARPHSRLCLGMMWIEDRFQTDPSTRFPTYYHNPMNMKTPSGGGWMQFPTYAAGIRGWRERITSFVYKPQAPGVYAKTTTVAELVHAYAPSSDNNDEANYVRTIELIVGELKQFERELGETPPPTEETPVAIDVNFQRALIGRSYGSLTQRDAWVTIHNTGNTVNAWAEHGFFKGGGGDQGVLVHFLVDEDVILQISPMHTRGVHAGSTAGNNTSIAIEMCARRGEFAKIEENTAKLLAMIYTRDERIDWSGAEGFTFSPKRTTDHRGWHGGNYSCPAMSAEFHGANVVRYMTDYAATFMDGVTPNPVPKVTPHPVGGEADGKGSTRVVNGTLWLWVNKMFFAEAPTINRYEYANIAGRQGPKIKGGKNIRVFYLVSGDGKDGEPELFGTTKDGWRVRMLDLVKG